MNMYISNLGLHASDDDLRKLFEPYGRVSSAKVILDRFTGNSRGFGFVEMDSVEEANRAITTLNGKEVEGKFISVSIARARENRNGQGF